MRHLNSGAMDLEDEQFRAQVLRELQDLRDMMQGQGNPQQDSDVPDVLYVRKDGRGNSGAAVPACVQSIGGVEEAPKDGVQRARQDGGWVEVSAGLPDAPADGFRYTRRDNVWAKVGYLGELDLPVFGNGGNARGTAAVDWQQERTLSSQVASGSRSTLCGGSGNKASGQYSSLCGGRENTSSGQYSSVVGGYNCIASNQFSSCGGGVNNSATANSSTVCGGQGNTAGGGFYNTVGGGYRNSITGYIAATIAGGENNTVSGYEHATIVGGSGCTASASNTIAGGFAAVAEHSGAVVLGYQLTSTSSLSFTCNTIVAKASASNVVLSDYNSGTPIPLIKTQQPAISDATTGTVVTVVNSILSALRTHGLIAT